MDREGNGIALAQRNDLGTIFAIPRGRCSVRTNSPPVKSCPGSERRIATWIGNARSP